MFNLDTIREAIAHLKAIHSVHDNDAAYRTARELEAQLQPHVLEEGDIAVANIRVILAPDGFYAYVDSKHCNVPDYGPQQSVAAAVHVAIEEFERRLVVRGLGEVG